GPVPGIKRRSYWAAYLARFDHLVGPTKPVVGTVRDKRTGKPIAGIKVGRSYEDEVQEHLYATTDAQGQYRLIGGPKRARHIVSDWGRAGDDGKFTVATIPGPGVLIVRAAGARRFALLEPTKELYVKYKVFLTQPALHAVVPINPSADEPKSRRQDIVLRS